MKLTFENIKSITRGAVTIEERDGYFRFERYSDEQKAAYDDRQRSQIRTSATTSVVLDFYTDSENITFDYEIDRLNMVMADFMFFDLWEDDIMTHHIGEYSTTPIKTTAHIKLSQGEKRVRLYLPNIFKMNIGNITLDEGATFRPTEKKRRALILGDSITQGFDAHFPSMSYPNILARDFELDMVNQSIGGEVFLPKSLGTSPLFDADIITVAYGTNDWLGGSPDFDAVEEYFEKLTALYPKAKKFYISPIWLKDIDKTPGGISFYDAKSRFEKCASDKGFTVVEGLKIMHHTVEMFSDGEHPNDLGFTGYAKLLGKKIKESGFEPA